ncbi:MAG: 3-hydroxybutyryl-CoA dehydrogenase [Saprospiraceae bacterium]|nr:3-hydroxybutyryl-CoA dehydrogenase [Saprospiraceae bacterium]
MNKIGVVGAGAMGTGIAQVAASAGYEVIIFDSNVDSIRKSNVSLENTIAKLLEKQKLTPTEAVEIRGRIYYVDQLSSLKDCHLIIEAILENMEIKQKLFQELEQIVQPNTILASNTSSLSLTSIASALQYPERFLGIHFFNPAPLMKLVEIIPASQTNYEIIVEARKMIDTFGKTTVIAKDTPGFIVNKVARPFYSESIRILEEGIADYKSIDNILKTKGGFRMGPFELMDFIGHDVNFKVTKSVWEGFFHEPRYQPSLTQQRLVDAGYLGRKSGKGFYDYKNAEQATNSPTPIIEQNAEKIFQRILAMLVNEAADTVYKGICLESDVELAVTLGVNYPKGLLAWGTETGIDKIIGTLDGLFEFYHEERYRVSPYLRKMK